MSGKVSANSSKRLMMSFLHSASNEPEEQKPALSIILGLVAHREASSPSHRGHQKEVSSGMSLIDEGGPPCRRDVAFKVFAPSLSERLRVSFSAASPAT